MRRLLLELRRRTQTRVLRSVRGSRLFPRTVVDRLGDDDRLGGASTDAAVMVYFPGAIDTLYQIDPWLPTFEALHAALRVVIVCQDSRVARHLRDHSPIPVLTVARYGTLDGVLARSDVKLALYVSHVARNFEALRFSSLLHAYIGHGDSDKGVSASNQLKAYDVVLAPGQAAVDRAARRLMRFDADARCIVVGQPLMLAAPRTTAPSSADVGATGGGAADPRTTVLYAPTWEGAQPSVAYSSVLSHGEALVDALLADDRFRVVYRPHPLIGVSSAAYAGADAGITARIAHAAAEDPAAGHRVVLPDDESLDASFERAGLLICDVSAVATAWLPSLKPLVVTEPAGEQAVSADSGMLGAVTRLSAADVPRVAALLRAELDSDAGLDVRRDLVAYYLSPYWPDRVTERFVSVCAALTAERDELRGRLLAAGATGV
ncbi:glycosyl transferase [uncultured Amnibacterium sp.]|uniref:glycosyl transferase n=1 Tax=uncultured Amnibacterium sp. TaxID=1631851 RepID=UPI0035C943C4